MNKLYIFLLAISLNSFSQTPFALFNSNSELFFVDTPGNYLKGLRPDSVKFSGGDSIYYHYRIYFNMISGCHYAKYPSWLGTKTIRKANEDYIFFNSVNDSILIKAAAATGTSWTFGKYAGGNYIKATVASRQYTTTYNGLSDTVKSITFQAYNSSNIPITHAYNTKVFKIARTQGIISMGSMYDFPTNATFYNRSYGKHLTIGDVCDMAPGDIVQRYGYFSNYNMSSPVTYTTYVTDTFATRVYITPDSVHITDTKGNLYKIGKLKSYVIKQMPEQAIVTGTSTPNSEIRQVMYMIYGSSSCQRTVISYVNDYCGYLESSTGDTCFTSASVSCTSWGDLKWYEKGWASPILDEKFMYPNYGRTARGISYSKISGVPCGVFYVMGIKESENASIFKIYPNPVTDFISIERSGSENEQVNLKISDVSGKIVLEQKNVTSKISTSGLDPGLYFLELNSKGEVFRNKFIKE